MQCSVFKTKWGWFGLLGSDCGIRKTCLPLADREMVKASLLENAENADRNDPYFSDCAALVQAYFEGRTVDFSSIRVDLSGMASFYRETLTALCTVNYGKIITYSDLAKLARRPKAVRAAAGAVAQNPIPLIVPCHRVIRKDGSLGGFSAPGGIETKKRLLALEKSR